MPVFLVDFGSTFVKYGAFDIHTGKCIFAGKRPFPAPCLQSQLRFEVSASAIRELLLSVFAEGADYNCSRAYISVQMHGFLLQDAQGNIGNYVSWRDKTGDMRIPVELATRGTSLKPNLPFAKLCKEEHKGWVFYTLGSYIAYLLAGTNVTHKTDACASGFFDASSLKADNSCGLVLPEVTHRVIPVGSWKGMRIYTPVGDHQISYLGSGAGEKDYLINIGTATQICCWGKPQSLHRAIECRPYVEDGWLYTVTGLTGGAELYAGIEKTKLCKELVNAIERLPKRESAIIGGGGGAAVFSQIKAALASRGITCRQAHGDIGMEGLRLMAQMQQIKIGTMLSEVPFTNFPIILKNTGLDFYIIDCEHGAFDYRTLSELITKSKLVGMNAIVRIGDNRREYITKLADMGASGFLLPMTGTPEDICAVVECAKYSPVGKRGISTTRAHTLYNPPELREYMETANARMQVYAQIETVQGVENALQILMTPGVSGVFIGPNDLSDDLRCIGDPGPVMACIEKVAAAARQAGKPWGIITANQMLLDCAFEQGVNMISCGSELNMLIDGCKKLTDKFKG